MKIILFEDDGVVAAHTLATIRSTLLQFHLEKRVTVVLESDDWFSSARNHAKQPQRQLWLIDLKTDDPKAKYATELGDFARQRIQANSTLGGHFAKAHIKAAELDDYPGIGLALYADERQVRYMVVSDFGERPYAFFSYLYGGTGAANADKWRFQKELLKSDPIQNIDAAKEYRRIIDVISEIDPSLAGPISTKDTQRTPFWRSPLFWTAAGVVVALLVGLIPLMVRESKQDKPRLQTSGFEFRVPSPTNTSIDVDLLTVPNSPVRGGERFSVTARTDMSANFSLISLNANGSIERINFQERLTSYEHPRDRSLLAPLPKQAGFQAFVLLVSEAERNPAGEIFDELKSVWQVSDMNGVWFYDGKRLPKRKDSAPPQQFGTNVTEAVCEVLAKHVGRDIQAVYFIGFRMQ